MRINGYDYNDHDRRSSTSSRSLSGIFIFLAFVAVYIFVAIHAHNMQAKNMAEQERIKAESERVIDDPYDPDYWYQDVYFTSREEIKEYPDCIIGIVSEIPNYEIWGSENIKVNGRIWIKVR